MNQIVDLAEQGWSMRKIARETGVTYNKVRRQLIKAKGKIRRGQGGPKPVLQYDLEGKLIARYRSGMHAHCRTGISQASISSCVRGVYKTAHGFVFKFADERHSHK